VHIITLYSDEHPNGFLLAAFQNPKTIPFLKRHYKKIYSDGRSLVKLRRLDGSTETITSFNEEYFRL